MNITLSIIYLIATITFVVGLKLLGHPETAKKGNLIAASGMGLAIVGTIVLHDLEVSNFVYILIVAAIIVGSIIGWLIAIKVQMTKMPELVSLFNGFGGASAALIGIIEYGNNAAMGNTTIMITILAAIVIGSITFSGSMIAWAKLNGMMWKDIRLPKYNLINNLFFIGLLIFSAYIVWSNVDSNMIVYLLLIAALVYGVLFVIPIGGADMP